MVQVLLVNCMSIEALVDVRHELRPVDIAVAFHHCLFERVANHLHRRPTAVSFLLVLAVCLEVLFVVLFDLRA